MHRQPDHTNTPKLVSLMGGSPGEGLDQKCGANAMAFEVINDLGEGNPTSTKSNQQSMAPWLRAIENEAGALGKRVAGFQAKEEPPNPIEPIPISSVQARTLMMTIPTRNVSFPRYPTLLSAATREQSTAQATIQVLPLREWRI